MLNIANAPASLPNLQSLATALTAFAHGMQSVSKRDLDAAQRDSATLDAQLWRVSQQIDQQAADQKSRDKQAKDPSKPVNSIPVNQVQPTDPNLEATLKNLAVLSLELRGAALVAGGKIPEAETLFAQARRQEAELGYREPPAFIQPVSELEAEFLTAAGQKVEAEKAWKQALEDRPNSGFALYGLALLAEKSGDNAKTSAAYNQFLTTWKTADPQLPQVQHAQQWLTAHPNQALATLAPR